MDRPRLPAQDELALVAADPTAFAGYLLASHGLPAHPLATTDGWSNRVWLAPAHVVRLSSGRFRDAYAHEAAVLGLLPPDLPHPHAVAWGNVGGREWMVLERLPGRPLFLTWSQMSDAQRRAAARQLATALRLLHGVSLPAGFRNPWLADALAPGGQLANAYHLPPAHYRPLLEAAARVPGADQTLLGEVDAFIAERLDAFSGDPVVLVHGDVHFANLLWDGHRLTALLDFECAQPAAPDLELDTLLRNVRAPDLYRAAHEPPGPTSQQLARLPDWLAAAYPQLFAHPRLTARLHVYDALWHLLQVQHFPPDSGPRDPWRHLRALLASRAPHVV
jgi:aminoglycoside phosphotransferase (APT) family kinase protein